MADPTAKNKNKKESTLDLTQTADVGVVSTSRKRKMHVPSPAKQKEKKTETTVNLIENEAQTKKSSHGGVGANSLKLHMPIDDQDSAMDFGINLVPQKIMEFSRSELLKMVGILLLFVVLAFVLIGGIYFYLQTKLDAREKEIGRIGFLIDGLNKESSLYEKNKDVAEELQLQVALAKQLVDDHVYWDQFFSLLEKTTLPDVYYLGLTLDQANVSLQALAKDYETMARQLKAFRQSSSVISAEVKSLQLVDERGSSSQRKLVAGEITLVLDPALFKKPLIVNGNE